MSECVHVRGERRMKESGKGKREEESPGES